MEIELATNNTLRSLAAPPSLALASHKPRTSTTTPSAAFLA